MENDGFDTGIQKCEVRRGLAQELGKRVEKMEGDLKAQRQKMEGGLNALEEAVQHVEKHKRWWDQELTEGKCSQIERDAGVKSVDQCTGIIRNAIAAMKHRFTVTSGKSEVYNEMLYIFEKIFEDEGKRGQAIAEYLKRLAEQNVLPDKEKRVPLARPPGVHPGNHLVKRKKPSVPDGIIKD